MDNLFAGMLSLLVVEKGTAYPVIPRRGAWVAGFPGTPAAFRRNGGRLRSEWWPPSIGTVAGFRRNRRPASARISGRIRSESVAGMVRNHQVDLPADREHLGYRQWLPLAPVRERFTLEQLHHQIVDAVLVTDVEERADVRVVELRDGARLALETGADLGGRGQARGQHLDRDIAAEAGVVGAIDLAHAAGAKGGEDPVGTELGAGCKSHGKGE